MRRWLSALFALVVLVSAGADLRFAEPPAACACAAMRDGACPCCRVRTTGQGAVDPCQVPSSKCGNASDRGLQPSLIREDASSAPRALGSGMALEPEPWPETLRATATRSGDSLPRAKGWDRAGGGGQRALDVLSRLGVFRI